MSLRLIGRRSPIIVDTFCFSTKLSPRFPDSASRAQYRYCTTTG